MFWDGTILFFSFRNNLFILSLFISFSALNALVIDYTVPQAEDELWAGFREGGKTERMCMC